MNASPALSAGRKAAITRAANIARATHRKASFSPLHPADRYIETHGWRSFPIEREYRGTFTILRYVHRHGPPTEYAGAVVFFGRDRVPASGVFPTVERREEWIAEQTRARA